MGLFNKIENFLENLQNEDINDKEGKNPTKCLNCGATIKDNECDYCGCIYKKDETVNDTNNFNGFKKDIQSAANKFGRLVNKIFVSDEEFKSNLKDKDE